MGGGSRTVKVAPPPSLATTPSGGRSSVADRAVVVVRLDDHGDASTPIVRVAPPADPGQIPCPEWSRGGERVAFRIGTDLWVADAASGETTVFPVAEAPRGQEGFEWSRDGSLIAVAEPGQLHVVRLDGGGPTVIPVAGGTPASLGWTAADETIVYLGDGDAVHVVGADGRNDTQIAPDPTDPAVSRVQFDVADAEVSPDGIRVAYAYHLIRCTSDGCTGDPERLLIMDLDGSNVVEVPIPPTSECPGCSGPRMARASSSVRSPVWSRSRRRPVRPQSSTRAGSSTWSGRVRR